MNSNGMLQIKNISKFPYRKQEPNDNCIPATVANVMQYHGLEIDQKEIRDIYTSYTKEQICFERIKKALEPIYGIRFVYEIKHRDKDFENFEEYLDFVKICIRNNLPLIVVHHFPKGDGTSRVHMRTLLGIDENSVLIYDTDPSEKSEPFQVSIEEFKRVVHPDFTTFLITPK